MLSFQFHDLDHLKLTRAKDFIHPAEPMPKHLARELHQKHEARRLRDEQRRGAARQPQQQRGFAQRLRGARRRA